MLLSLQGMTGILMTTCLIVSKGSVLLIFLDHHKRTNIVNAILFASVAFFAVMLLGLVITLIKFDILWLIPVVPIVLFGGLFLKNSLNKRADESLLDEKLPD